MSTSTANVTTHFDYMDGKRGLSIVCVLQGHFTKLWFDVGGFGVYLFFCLSGLLMSNILFSQRQPLGKFYRRRISRIAPAFIVFVIAMLVLAAANGRVFSSAELWSTLAFTRTYFPAPGIWGTGMPIGHLWSLNVEEHCYIFMSLLVILCITRGYERVILIACGFACIAIGFLYVKMGASAPRWGHLGTEVAGSFLLISAGYRLVGDSFRPLVPPWLPILTLMTALSIGQIGPWWATPLLLPPLPAFTTNHLSEAASWFLNALSSAPLRKIGTWSFSIYLWQQPFDHYKAMLPGGPMVALAGAMLVALMSFNLIEQPTRAWLNRYWTSWIPGNKGNST